VLRGPGGVASFDRLGVQGLLTVTLLVSRAPGSMPANLARDVEAFSARVEAAIAAHPRGRLEIEVSEAEVPVVEFVARQAELRARLPMRTLQTCTTCKLERVVNPDFKRLQDQNRRKQVLTGAIGATVSSRGVNPFFLVGSLLRLKSSEIEYVCPRCQGLDADTTVVTFCPSCGDRRGEAVLRRCPRCDHGFASVLADAEPLWQPDPVAVPPALGAPAPFAAPAAGPAPYGASPPPPFAPVPGPPPPLLCMPVPPGAVPPPGATVGVPSPSLAALPPPVSLVTLPDAAAPEDRSGPADERTAPTSPALPDRLDLRSSSPATLASAPPAAPPPKRRADPVRPQPAPIATPVMPPAIMAAPPPGWFPDPSGRHHQRHWDGRAWTPFVLDHGAHGYDPI
jgi:hypothetical protein